ncbi:response regulator transcription factor [Cryptosporangium japonicum]
MTADPGRAAPTSADGPSGVRGLRPGEALSAREIEVLRELAAGRSNAEIAAALFVARGTVKAHLHHIFRKLGATSRLQAVARARDAGLLE